MFLYIVRKYMIIITKQKQFPTFILSFAETNTGNDPGHSTQTGF